MDPAARPPDTPDPLIGRVLSGHYRVDARIGGGAMGTVYRARHTLLQQDFAVKVLAGELAGDADVRRRFLVEARSLALFVHKHAVQVRDCGEDAGVLYLAMDFCPGETLSDLLAREGPLVPRRAVRIAIQVLQALDEAHRAGIVHRDLKPGNVMVETKPAPAGPIDDVRVVDFGLVRIVGAERGALPDAFASIGGDVVGTIAYMSPEQLRADDDVDGRSDLFSVGVVLYEMLAGGSPFPGVSTMSIAMKIVESQPAAWPESVAPAVGASLNAVLAKALSKRPDDRFATAGDMALALHDAMAGGAPIGPPSVRTSNGGRVADAVPAGNSGVLPPSVSRRRRVVRYVVAGILVALLAFAVFAALEIGAAMKDHGARVRASGLSREGRYAEAISAWSDVIDRLPRDGFAFLARAMARTELGDRNAPADLDEAERLLPNDARVFVARGRYLWRVEKNGERADEQFVRALTIDPDQLDARVERALVHLDRGESARVEPHVAALEKRAPSDARVPWLRSRARALAGSVAPTAEEARRLNDEAVELARQAIAQDDSFADAASALAMALAARAYAAKNRGEYDASRNALEEAIAAATLALERAAAHPDYRGQGGMRAALLRQRSAHHIQQEDHAAALEDLDAALAIAPRDPFTLSNRAYARQQSGDHEGAIRDFERLYDVTNDPDHLFRQGFGWQRVGDGRADVGDGPAAIEAYSKAIEVYGAGLVRLPDRPEFSTYRGETRVRRARWLSGAARDAEWKAAEADFAESLRLKPKDPEVLLRRCEYYLARNDAARALDDVRVAIGDSMGRTPRFYARRAMAAMLGSREAHVAGDAVRAHALADEAVESAIRARDLLPSAAGDLVPVIAEAYVRAAEAASDAAKKGELLAKAEAALTDLSKTATGEESDAVQTRTRIAYVRAGAALVAGDKAAALRFAQEAVDVRAAEAKARRWYEDARYVERLAEALDATGGADAARAARERAKTLPR